MGLLMLEDEVSPRSSLAPSSRSGSVRPHRFGEDLHPALLLPRRISIEVNALSIREADAESLLDKHIRAIFLVEGRLTATAGFAVLARRGGVGLSESGLVIDEFDCFGEV